MKQTYDVVVVGAGSGGLTSAVGFSKVGKKVLLVEKEHLGGECTNTGCVPSKALLHRAKEFYTAKKIAGETEASETYRHAAFTYVRNVIDGILAHETPETFEKIGIDVVMGEAVFEAENCVRVGETQYEFKYAVIATGSSPRMIDVSGLEEQDLLTNQNIFMLDHIPEKTLVIGSGPIGLEMGQALAMLGSQVTIATIDSEFAKLEDPSIRPILEASLTDLGIRIVKSAFINRIENRLAFFDIKEGAEVVGEERVHFDKVLLAIGRVPNIPRGLELAGIKATKHGIEVDSQHRTNNKKVYALGDVAQRLKFTHTADDTARQVVTRVTSKGFLKINKKKAVPKVTYTSPEVAQVGLSFEEAKAKYGEKAVKRIEAPFSANDRAITDSATDGLLVVIACRLSGRVLGAHIIGPSAGELLAPFTIAIDQKISMWKLQRTIFAYPTYSLIIKKAGDFYFAKQMADLKTDIMNLLKQNLPKIIAAIFWLTLFLTFQNYRASNDLSYEDVLFQLIDFFTSTVWGPITYMVLYAIRPLILFPATLLTALSGALFGLWWGIIYTVIGENASANFAYWIGRFFGKGWRLEDSIIGSWIEKLRDNTFEAVLLMRLFYVPFDLTNYGSGIAGARWREYFFATLIGIMPGLTTFVALGAALDLESFRMDGLTFDAFDPKFLALSVVIFVVSLLLSRFLKKRHKHA